MKNFLDELQNQRDTAEKLAAKAECGESYMEEMNAFLSALNETIAELFERMQDPVNPIDLSQDFVLQVLNDIIYGIEKKDSVCLADVLRYGLIEIFDYVVAEMQRGEGHE